MNRSPRPRGQALVLVGALLGAIGGVTLGLAAGDTQSFPTVAEPRQEHRTAVAARSPGTSPPPSLESSSGGGSDGDDPVGVQRAESPDRATKLKGTPGKAKDHGKDKADKAKAEAKKA